MQASLFQTLDCLSGSWREVCSEAYNTCTALLPHSLVCSLPSTVITSPVPSVSSSCYKQRWRSSLHDTRHPIVLRRSFVLQRFSFMLRRSSLVLQQVLADALIVLACALMVLARNSMGLTRNSMGLTHNSTGFTRCFMSHVTRDKVWSIPVVGVSILYLYKPKINKTNTVRYCSVTGKSSMAQHHTKQA